MEATTQQSTGYNPATDGASEKPRQASRFDYVAYDSSASQDQAHVKELVTILERSIEITIKCQRSKALALTNLEQTYMWIGKGIRNDQISRNGSAPLQESRNNS